MCPEQINRFRMPDPFDPLTYELCFPGGLTGETEIYCPHCKMA